MGGAAHLRGIIRTAISQLTETYFANKFERYVIYGLVSADFIFILLHLAYLTSAAHGYEHEWLRNTQLRIDRDRAYPEVFNYLKEITCVMLLAGAFVVSGHRIYICWALVFAFVFFDDALSFHELLGAGLNAVVTLPELPGLRLQDTGELIAWAGAGALLLPPLVWGFRASRGEAVGFGALFLVVFTVLVVFAVGVDMLHVAVGARSPSADVLLGIVEDGGEMLALTLACACSLLVYRRSKPPSHAA